MSGLIYALIILFLDIAFKCYEARILFRARESHFQPKRIIIQVLILGLFVFGGYNFYVQYVANNRVVVVNAVALDEIIAGTYRPHINGQKDMSREMIITEPGENQFLIEIVSDEDPLQYCSFEIDGNGKLFSTELGVGTVAESEYNEVIITFTDGYNNVLKLVRIKKREII